MITEKEFKKIFELADGCCVSKDMLKQFTNQIKGAYLLYKDICNVSDIKLTNVDGTLLQAEWEPYAYGFQHFVYTLGSKSKFHVSYLDEYGKPVPFWTYTKYGDKCAAMKIAAYNIFESRVLCSLFMKYVKYGFTYRYRTMDTKQNGCHPNQSIWWDGIIFNSLYYINKNEEYVEIPNYDIVEVILNSNNVWNGPIVEPIQKIIDRIEKRN